MSDIPQGLKFTKSHEWVEVSGDGIITVGITDHAQELLGDMVFVDLPDEGADVEAETECAVVESVKAASDIYSPVNGEVTEINEELSDAPELVNSAPYGEGWIFKVKMSDETQLDELLDAEAYQAIVDAEAH